MRKSGGRLVGSLRRYDHDVRDQQLAARQDHVDCFKHIDVRTRR